MSVIILLVGLMLIRRTLKDSEHLMVNEKYMALHLVFFLLTVSSNAFVLIIDENKDYYYFL